MGQLAQRGQAIVEYLLIAAAIVAAIVALKSEVIQVGVNGLMGAVETQLENKGDRTADSLLE